MKNKKVLNATLIAIGAITTIGAPIGVMHAVNQSSHSATLITKPKKELVIHRDKPLTAMELINKIILGELGILDLSVKDYLKIIEALKTPHSEIRFLVENQSPQSKAIVDQMDKIDIGTFKLVLKIIFERGLGNVTKDEITKVQKTLNLLFKNNDNNWWFNLLKYIPTIISDGLGKLFLDNDEDFFQSLNLTIVHNILQDVVKKQASEAIALQAKLIKIANEQTSQNSAQFTSSFVPKFSNAAANAMILAKASSKSQAKLAELIKTSVLKTFETNKEQAFNDIIPIVVKQISGVLVNKPDLKIEVDKKAFAQKLESLEKNLFNLFHKVLIIGFTSSREIAKDISTILYQITNKIPESYVYSLPVPVLGTFDINILVKPILEDALDNLIQSMLIPSKDRIDQDIVKIKKSKQKNLDGAKKLAADNVKLLSEIAKVKARKIALSDAEYKKMKPKINAFKKNGLYSYKMFLFGLDNDALGDINKFAVDSNYKDFYGKANTFLRAKWYQDKYKGYWVLARSLWNLYPRQNKTYDTQAKWFSQLASDWKHGITEPPYDSPWWKFWENDRLGGGASKNPNFNQLSNTIKVAYNEAIWKEIETRWNELQSKQNQNLIAAHFNQKITTFDLNYNMAIKLKEYETKLDDLAKLYEQQSTNNKVKVELYKKVAAIDKQIKGLQNSNVYLHEFKNKITAKMLASNGLLHQKGLLKLTPIDVSNIIYKMQDLLLGLNDYLNKTIDATVANTSFGNALVNLAIKNISSIRKEAKSAIKDQIKPLLATIPQDLVKKINSFSSNDLSLLMDDLINKGLAKTSNTSLISLALTIKKFINLPLTNQDILNTFVALKTGFNALSYPNRVELIKTFLNFARLQKSTNDLIKSLL